MSLFLFEDMFIQKINENKKTGALRKSRRGEVGEVMHLYRNNGDKGPFKIKEAILTEVFEISIDEHGRLHAPAHKDRGYLYKRCGFNTPQDFLDYYKNHYGLPFKGFFHGWQPEMTNTRLIQSVRNARANGNYDGKTGRLKLTGTQGQIDHWKEIFGGRMDYELKTKTGGGV